MASIHKQPGRPNWFASYSIFNPETNRWRRVFRSTETSNKKQALEIMRAWDKAARKAKTGTLTEEAARRIIAEGVSEVLMVANIHTMQSASIEDWCETWLAGKKIEIEESTHQRYTGVIKRFINFLGGAKARRDLTTLQAHDIARFRDRESTELSRATANLGLTILRNCFNEAVQQYSLTVNPAVRVKKLKLSKESKRRGFTLPEIRRILEACGDDVEWRGLVLFGLYLGQRLGDLAKLTWRAVNLETNEVAFTTRKTGRRIVLPLMQPLADYLSELSAGDNPNAHIFPKAAKFEKTCALSGQFREILVEAGLVEPREYSRTNTQGRSGPRETSELSFHSLRHSAVTMLKAAGVSDFIAREIVGHESAAVSRQYTHLTTDDKLRAMSKVPDVSTPSKAKRTKKG